MLMHMYMYMTGSVDIFLLQFSSSGGLLWTEQTGTSSADVGSSVAVSLDGLYVYVAGYTSLSLNGQPYAGNGILLYIFVLRGKSVIMYIVVGRGR
jgi:hypothetical protein